METKHNYQETDLGNVSPNPRGEYDPKEAYEYLDLVSYQGGSYLCLTELETTITGTAPEPGHNTEFWQLLTLPGNLTAEAVAMHDDVVNKAAQVEISRAAVEQAQQEVETSQADVQQLHEDTVQAAQKAENSRDSAAGYAQSAEASRKAAAESEQNINAQMTDLDQKVSESVTQAQEEIATARQQAINTITTQEDTSTEAVKQVGTAALESARQALRDINTAGQQAVQAVTDQKNTSVQAVKDETEDYIEDKKKEIDDKTDEVTQAVNQAGKKQLEDIANSLDSTLTKEGKAADSKAVGAEIIRAKQEVNKHYISCYVANTTPTITQGVYDVTDIVDNMISTGIKKIIVDVDAYMSHPLTLVDNLEIYGEGGHILYFESGDGIKIDTKIKNTSVHDLNIRGYNVLDSDKWLIDIGSDSSNTRFYNLNVEFGYNGIRVNGWISNYLNIRVSYFKGIGLYIDRSDNTFSTFYINGCAKQGLYMTSSNNRIDNFKILSCGEDCESAYFSGSRNTISNFEIQDIYIKCAIFQSFNNNIVDINLDGIRTNLTDSNSYEVASFINSSCNVIRLISSKYGGGTTETSDEDIIKFKTGSESNNITAILLKVEIVDEDTSNQITKVKRQTVKYNMDNIKKLSSKYKTEKYAIRYLECVDITKQYDDSVIVFQNSGNVDYSGPRFILEDKTVRKLFGIAIVSTNSPVIPNNYPHIRLTSQQEGNVSNIIRPNGNIEDEYVIISIGTDTSELNDWTILNIEQSSEAITKIKYFNIFSFEDYTSIMNDIVI